MAVPSRTPLPTLDALRATTAIGLICCVVGFSTSARAQDATTLEPITVEGQGAAAELRSRDTGAGQVNEQKGFVAKRSGSATKTNTPLIETPQSISVVTEEQIKTQEVRTIRAATRYTAGVTPEVTGGADTRFGGFNIRGFDSTANASFFDGMRLPSTAVINFFGLDPYGAERIEILKGPSSVLYGQNGPGGLVNYVTKKPTKAPFREIEVNGGSFNLLEGRFDFSGPIEGTDFSYRLTGVGRNSDNQVDTVKDDRFFIAPSFSWNPSDDTSLTVSGAYQRDRAGWGLQFLPASGTISKRNGRRLPRSTFLGDRDFDDYDTDYGTVGYQFSHKFNEVFTFRQNARFAAIDHSERSIYGGGWVNEADETNNLINRNAGAGDSDLRTFAIDNQVQAEFETGPLKHTALVGLDYRTTKFNDRIDAYFAGPIDAFNPGSGLLFPVGTYYDNDVRQKQTGLYFQDQIKIDRLSVLLSGRYDWATTTLERDATPFVGAVDAKAKDGAFTGRAGLIYNFDNGIAPYVSYSESFLPPLDVSAVSGLFKPEEGRQYEAGVKFEPKGLNTVFTASVFELTRDNVIRYQAGAPFQARQTGQIRSKGVELEAVSSITDNLNLRLAYTYLDVEITKDPDAGNEGRRPTTVPKHSASAWADYKIKDGSVLDGFGAGLGVRYIGSTFGDDANTFKVPGATVFDGMLSYERGIVKVSLNGTNLFDKKYVASCGNSTFYCFYAEGRRVTAKAAVRW